VGARAFAIGLLCAAMFAREAVADSPSQDTVEDAGVGEGEGAITVVPVAEWAASRIGLRQGGAAGWYLNVVVS